MRGGQRVSTGKKHEVFPVPSISIAKARRTDFPPRKPWTRTHDGGPRHPSMSAPGAPENTNEPYGTWEKCDTQKSAQVFNKALKWQVYECDCYVIWSSSAVSTMGWATANSVLKCRQSVISDCSHVCVCVCLCRSDTYCISCTRMHTHMYEAQTAAGNASNSCRQCQAKCHTLNPKP